ncbi:hypothetical protein NVIE_010610 [Nitrososphaera viennensis EN76]|uniref:Uncharacterized protein n=1 Tax=Nitrososphaera viennensis EN76 TaxID=926571 RepID=A0A060HIC3_9ARCH|nr:hypothetical protein NVIE_010610 [Nitrososphaera viennensis EN76]
MTVALSPYLDSIAFRTWATNDSGLAAFIRHNAIVLKIVFLSVAGINTGVRTPSISTLFLAGPEGLEPFGLQNYFF